MIPGRWRALPSPSRHGPNGGCRTRSSSRSSPLWSWSWQDCCATPSTLGQVIDAMGRRVLGSDSLHAADVARDHHGSRARDLASDAAPDSRRCPVAGDAKGSGGTGHRVCAREFVAELGIQSGVQCRARARDRETRRRRRLPCPGGGQLSRARQRVGAGAQRLGGIADGHARCPAAGDPRDRRSRRHRARGHHRLPRTRFSCGRVSSPCSSRSSSSRR